ncbi:MAG: methyltransferase domain-containing protein [Thermoleophilia bacterium]
MGPPPNFDWNLGSYEATAERLVAGAARAVERAAPRAGERVVDVGCGTGNAALLAAARGAAVTGVDPASRLLEVARHRALAQGLRVEFVPGDAAALPLPTGSADVLLSVFAVIFAPDPQAAVAEMARVAAPTARAVLTAWIPEGTMAEMRRAVNDALAEAADPGGGDVREPPPFAWHDPEFERGLWVPHGFAVTVEDAALTMEAASVEDYLVAQHDLHPMSVARRARMGEAAFAGLRERCRAILNEGNEDPAAFRLTSRYALITATRATALLRPPGRLAWPQKTSISR